MLDMIKSRFMRSCVISYAPKLTLRTLAKIYYEFIRIG